MKETNPFTTRTMCKNKQRKTILRNNRRKANARQERYKTPWRTIQQDLRSWEDVRGHGSEDKTVRMEKFPQNDPENQDNLKKKFYA